MRATGWNERGFFSRRIDDTYCNGPHLRDSSSIDVDDERIIALSADRFEAQLEQARQKLRAVCPPDVPTRYWTAAMPNLSYLGSTAFGSNTQVSDFYGFGFLVECFAVLPAIWMVAACVKRVRTQRQLRIGCCRTCGYDLRATPDRCPECGAAPVAIVDPASL